MGRKFVVGSLCCLLAFSTLAGHRVQQGLKNLGFSASFYQTEVSFSLNSGSSSLLGVNLSTKDDIALAFGGSVSARRVAHYGFTESNPLIFVNLEPSNSFAVRYYPYTYFSLNY